MKSGSIRVNKSVCIRIFFTRETGFEPAAFDVTEKPSDFLARGSCGVIVSPFPHGVRGNSDSPIRMISVDGEHREPGKRSGMALLYVQ